MAKKFDVYKSDGKWVGYDARGNVITQGSDESAVRLAMHHWSTAPSLMKVLGFVKESPVLWRARPFYSTTVRLIKGDRKSDGSRVWRVIIDFSFTQKAVFIGDDERKVPVHQEQVFGTRQEALEFVREFGQKVHVATRNIRNPESPEILIALSQRGSCTDPGTERYHCM